MDTHPRRTAWRPAAADGGSPAYGAHACRRMRPARRPRDLTLRIDRADVPRLVVIGREGLGCDKAALCYTDRDQLMPAAKDLHQKIAAFHNRVVADPHHRYRSWEHCYGFFRARTPAALIADKDAAALQ